MRGGGVVSHKCSYVNQTNIVLTGLLGIFAYLIQEGKWTE